MTCSWTWDRSVSKYYAPWVEPHAQSLAFARGEAARIARFVSANDLALPTGDEGWTLRDEMVHIIASDDDFVVTLSSILDGAEPDTRIFADIDERNSRNLSARRQLSTSDIASALERGAHAIDELVLQLGDDDEQRTPRGVPMSLGQLIAGYSRHAPYHLGQINAALDRAQGYI